jgi:hypothetical protein
MIPSSSWPAFVSDNWVLGNTKDNYINDISKDIEMFASVNKLCRLRAVLENILF